MATHSSVLAWRIPGTGEPGGLPSMVLHRVGHDWSDLAAAAAFLKVQLSHPYVTSAKNIALTRQAFVGKVMFLLFNMLSSLVIAFLPKSKCLLISWLQGDRVEGHVLIFSCKNSKITNGCWTTIKSRMSTSGQFSRSLVCDSLWPHELQQARPPCPSPTPRVHSNSRPSSQWCLPAISSSVVFLPPIPPSISLLQWVNSSQQVAKVLEFQL